MENIFANLGDTSRNRLGDFFFRFIFFCLFGGRGGRRTHSQIFVCTMQTFSCLLFLFATLSFAAIVEAANAPTPLFNCGSYSPQGNYYLDSTFDSSAYISDYGFPACLEFVDKTTAPNSSYELQLDGRGITLAFRSSHYSLFYFRCGNIWEK
jgi:hypothetical protein